MTPQPPPGQGPVDPRGAFSPPPPPRAPAGMGFPMPPSGMPPMMMPPPGFMPPGFMPPYGPPQPPPRRGFFRSALRFVLVMALFGSIALNLMLVGSRSLGGRSTLQTSIQDGDVHETIAVIPVSGVIMEPTAERFARHMSTAESDSNVKAIVIAVETPGGAVTASDEIYHRIDQFKSAHPSVPVVVSMGNLATSGGYYVASRADYIVAQPTTMTGNIGVLMPRYNASELAKKWGIQETTVTAPKVGFKNSGSMFQPESEADAAYWQSLIDGAYKRFLKVVKDGRGARLKKPIEQIADGKVYLADDALAAGLVDEIGFPDDAYAYAAKKAGLSRPMVVKYRDPPSLLDLFGGESKFNGSGSSGGSGGSGAAAGTTVNGVNVNLNLDAGMLDALRTPRVLYMWQGQ